MSTQHVLFAHPHATPANEPREDDTESEPETLDADTQQQETTTDNTKETDDTDSDEPTPDWTVPPASTFLRFYSEEPGYLKPTTERDMSTTATTIPDLTDTTSLMVVSPSDSITSQHRTSLNPSRSLNEDEGSSSVSPPNLGTPTPQWGQYRQELPSFSLWDASPPPTQQSNYLSRPCSICEKTMVTLNPFKTLT
jgi:hypothetical protein